MSDSLNPHVSDAGTNLPGSQLDVLIRPNRDLDGKVRLLMEQIIENLMVLLPKETELAVRDAAVRAVEEGATQNLTRISGDEYNAITEGRDGRLYVGRRYFESELKSVPVGTPGTVHSFVFELPEGLFTDTSYHAGIEPIGTPDAVFAWSIASKSIKTVIVNCVGGAIENQFRLVCVG